MKIVRLLEYLSLTLALSVVACILFSGCGGTEQETTTTVTGSESASSNNTYTASFDDVKVSFTLPAEDDSTVEAIKDYISKVGTSKEPITLGCFTINNGSSNTTRCELFSFSLTYADGKQIDGQQAFIYVGNLENLVPINDERELYNEGVALYNQLLERTDIMPGASRTAYCVFEVGDLAGLNKVFVSHYLRGTKEMKK